MMMRSKGTTACRLTEYECDSCCCIDAISCLVHQLRLPLKQRYPPTFSVMSSSKSQSITTVALNAACCTTFCFFLDGPCSSSSNSPASRFALRSAAFAFFLALSAALRAGLAASQAACLASFLRWVLESGGSEWVGRAEVGVMVGSGVSGAGKGPASGAMVDIAVLGDV